MDGFRILKPGQGLASDIITAAADQICSSLRFFIWQIRNDDSAVAESIFISWREFIDPTSKSRPRRRWPQPRAADLFVLILQLLP